MEGKECIVITFIRHTISTRDVCDVIEQIGMFQKYLYDLQVSCSHAQLVEDKLDRIRLQIQELTLKLFVDYTIKCIIGSPHWLEGAEELAKTYGLIRVKVNEEENPPTLVIEE